MTLQFTAVIKLLFLKSNNFNSEVSLCCVCCSLEISFEEVAG